GVVRRDELVELLFVLEQRLIDDPQKVPARWVVRIARPVLRDEPQLLAQVEPQIREHRVDLGFLAELEEDQVAGLRSRRRVHRGARLLADRLCPWALRPVPLLVHCSYAMRWHGIAIGTPSASSHSAVTSSSTSARKSSCETKDISRSICVNSGCRSSRRSSSRKHFTIWK